MNQEILKHKKKIIEICKDLKISRLYLFGSVLKSDFNENSDIDVLLSFSDDLSVEEYTENYFSFHYKLRELFNRDIDVLTEKSISNPFLLESINKNKLLIYEA